MPSKKVTVIHCSLSMGCSTKNRANEDINLIFRDAESKMYQYKSALRNTYATETLNALIRYLHETSPYEKFHSENTSTLCRKMGEALGWSDAAVKTLSDAGYYHDIGKVVLSSSLINKHTNLSLPEHVEKQKHSFVGYRILNLFETTLDLADAVLYHHEKWDGSGYPKGLIGEEIPIMSRIIALCEHYDRLTNSKGVHPMTKEKALRKSRQCRKRFDPNLCICW